MIAIEPVIAPAAILSAINTELETMESIAAPDLVRITTPPPASSRGSGPLAPGG